MADTRKLRVSASGMHVHTYNRRGNRERDRRLGGKLGRGTAKQKFRECNLKGRRERQKIRGVSWETEKQIFRECNWKGGTESQNVRGVNCEGRQRNICLGSVI
jgi:hypothetical protein